jgi:hypothetical protein
MATLGHKESKLLTEILMRISLYGMMDTVVGVFKECLKLLLEIKGLLADKLIGKLELTVGAVNDEDIATPKEGIEVERVNVKACTVANVLGGVSVGIEINAMAHLKHLVKSPSAVLNVLIRRFKLELGKNILIEIRYVHCVNNVCGDVTGDKIELIIDSRLLNKV